MSKYSELKRAAEAVKQTYAALCEHGGDELAEAWNSAELAYDDAANPDAVLELIAENEVMLKALEIAKDAMWKADSNMDNEAADIRDLLVSLSKDAGHE